MKRVFLEKINLNVLSEYYSRRDKTVSFIEVIRCYGFYRLQVYRYIWFLFKCTTCSHFTAVMANGIVCNCILLDTRWQCWVRGVKYPEKMWRWASVPHWQSTQGESTLFICLFSCGILWMNLSQQLAAVWFHCSFISSWSYWSKQDDIFDRHWLA